ncbi:uncharacterized protein LODBEIA_P23000 [Lodderomyces beijingensis]|uniref:Uncharacterized protein n=1 Tax=Lodderomyces beijingensis TaxID=1775926 RepID=A0ABP0ZLT7_9ASCO
MPQKRTRIPQTFHINKYSAIKSAAGGGGWHHHPQRSELSASFIVSPNEEIEMLVQWKGMNIDRHLIPLNKEKYVIKLLKKCPCIGIKCSEAFPSQNVVVRCQISLETAEEYEQCCQMFEFVGIGVGAETGAGTGTGVGVGGSRGDVASINYGHCSQPVARENGADNALVLRPRTVVPATLAAAAAAATDEHTQTQYSNGFDIESQLESCQTQVRQLASQVQMMQSQTGQLQASQSQCVPSQPSNQFLPTSLQPSHFQSSQLQSGPSHSSQFPRSQLQTSQLQSSHIIQGADASQVGVQPFQQPAAMPMNRASAHSTQQQQQQGQQKSCSCQQAQVATGTPIHQEYLSSQPQRQHLPPPPPPPSSHFHAPVSQSPQTQAASALQQQRTRQVNNLDAPISEDTRNGEFKLDLGPYVVMTDSELRAKIRERCQSQEFRNFVKRIDRVFDNYCEGGG